MVQWDPHYMQSNLDKIFAVPTPFILAFHVTFLYIFAIAGHPLTMARCHWSLMCSPQPIARLLRALPKLAIIFLAVHFILMIYSGKFG